MDPNRYLGSVAVNLQELAVSGPLALACGVALLAGAVSFASPCVVPLVPGYLSYLAGLVGAQAPAVTADEPRAAGRWRLAGAAGLFVAGFSVVFVALPLGMIGLADALLRNEDLLRRLGGVLTILMGLVFVGLVPGTDREYRWHHVPRLGLAGAPLLGVLFGLGWTPCLGPMLTAVMSVSVGTGGRGVALLLAYCVGLGVPFLLLALGAGWALSGAAWLRRHGRAIQILGGVLLLIIGLALITGLWGELVALIRTPISEYRTPI